MLVNLLKLHFGWHLARIKCLASIIVALFKIKTVNLTEVATACPGTAEIESHDKRLQRFFKQVESKPSLIATCVVAFLPYETSTLSMDRTNWMLGCFNSNFLVLSVVHEGIAFPVLWLFLPKKGNANTKERMQLIDKFIEIFGVEKIDCLLGDRECIGETWFAYLPTHRIKFCLRIKSDRNLSRTNGILAPASHFFRRLPVGTSCALVGPRLVCGQRLWVTGGRLPSGEYLLIVSNYLSDTVLED